MKPAHPACATLLILAAALGPSAAACHPEEATLQGLTIADLKRLYLSCERATRVERLSFATIARCSVLYEVLKEHAFDGDFEKFLTWSRSQEDVAIGRE
jgi:hypothetical protein